MSNETFWTAFVKAQAEFPGIPKDSKATVKGKTKDGRYYEYEYGYASLPAVMAIVLPVLNKHGIAVMQSFSDGRLITNLVHTSGEGVESVLDCSDAGMSPQDFGKKISYYRRYSVVPMLGLAPDDDNDAAGVPPADPGPPPADPPPDPVPEPSEHEITVRKLFADGMAALLGNVDNPEAEMKTRMSDILGSMGFEKAGEITARYQQEEFYNTVKEVIAEIREQHPSPVS